MAFITWERYSFNGSEPTGEGWFNQFKDLTAPELSNLLIELRRGSWQNFRAKHMSSMTMLVCAPVIGILLAVSGSPLMNGSAPLLGSIMAITGGILFLGSIRPWLSIVLSATTKAEALGAESLFLQRAHELVQQGGTYAEYRQKHLAEINTKSLVSEDARLALLCACFGLMIIPIPLCGPLAIILGHLGRRKRARFATVALLMGYIEVIGLLLFFKFS